MTATGERPLVSFIVPVRNDARRLQRCLASIRRARYADARVEIIVVDNGSTDGSDEVSREAGARFVALPGVCVAALRNHGSSIARGDVLAFVDADHELVDGWIEAAAETLADEAVVAVGAPYHAPANGTWVQTQYDRLRRRSESARDVDWLGSGNLAVRHRAFDRVGGFDTVLETCEDVDLCQRLRATGGRIVSDPRLKSTHYGDPSTLLELFAGELWRGRDNLRVSLRPPLGWRNVASALIPLAELTLLAIGLVGLVLTTHGGLAAALLALAGILVLTTIQWARMLQSSAVVTTTDAVQTFAVAGVFGLARALALVARPSHRVRRHESR